MQNAKLGAQVQSSLTGSLSPPYSNPSHSPEPAIPGSLPGSPASLVESLASPAMLDKSRLALCMVMFTVVLFNPLAHFFSDSESLSLYDTGGATGRTILERNEEMNMTTILRVSTSSLMLSMFNVLFILACLVRIFVYGEPKVEKAWAKYWRYRKQAERDIDSGRAADAKDNLQAALLSLGRPPPVSRLDCLSSLFWQLLHLAMDKLKLPALVRTLMNVDKK